MAITSTCLRWWRRDSRDSVCANWRLRTVSFLTSCIAVELSCVNANTLVTSALSSPSHGWHDRHAVFAPDSSCARFYTQSPCRFYSSKRGSDGFNVYSQGGTAAFLRITRTDINFIRSWRVLWSSRRTAVVTTPETVSKLFRFIASHVSCVNRRCTSDEQHCSAVESTVVLHLVTQRCGQTSLMNLHECFVASVSFVMPVATWHCTCAAARLSSLCVSMLLARLCAREWDVCRTFDRHSRKHLRTAMT